MKHLRYILLSLLLITNTAYADYMSDLVITGTSGIWTDSRSFTDLSTAISTIGADEVDLYISEEESVTTLTIPSNIRLHFLKSGAINNSSQLVINCKNIDAPNRQIFTGVGDIDFAQGSYVKSSWFDDLERAIEVTEDDYLTLEISDQTYLDGDAAVGNNVTLKFTSTVNKIIVNSGITLSNVHSIEAGLYQIFAGAGDIDFTDGTTLQLDWFRRLRSLTTWVESEKVKVIVNGSNTVDYSQTSPQNIVYDLTNGSFAISNGITLTVFSRYNLLHSSNNTISSGLGTLAFSHEGIDALQYLDSNQVGNSVYLVGRATVNDGGQGTFAWLIGDYTTQVTADTMSGIYAPSDADSDGSDGCWVRQFSGPIYAPWFGLIANSSDAAAGNVSAIAAAQAVGLTINNLDVLLPNGAIYLNDTITVGAGNRSVLRGASQQYGYEKRGSGGTRLIWTVDPTSGIGLDMGNYGTYYYSEAKNLIIDGNGVLDTGVTIGGAKLLTNCDVRNTVSKGVHLDSIVNQTKLYACNIIGNVGDGLYSDAVLTTTFVVDNCNIRENGGRGVYLASWMGATFRNCVIESNSGVGIDIYKITSVSNILNQNNQFQNCWIENNNTGGVGDTYQIVIDGDNPSNSFFPQENTFYKCQISGRATTGGRWVHLVRSASTTFNECKFLNGDGALTDSEKFLVESATIGTQLINCGKPLISYSNVTIIEKNTFYPYVGFGVGGTQSRSFTTGSIAASGTKSYQIGSTSIAGIVIVTAKYNAGAGHRRAMGLFDKNNGTLDMTELYDGTNILSVDAGNSYIVITNNSAVTLEFVVTFIGYNAGSIVEI